MTGTTYVQVSPVARLAWAAMRIDAAHRAAHYYGTGRAWRDAFRTEADMMREVAAVLQGTYPSYAHAWIRDALARIPVRSYGRVSPALRRMAAVVDGAQAAGIPVSWAMADMARHAAARS